MCQKCYVGIDDQKTQSQKKPTFLGQKNLVKLFTISIPIGEFKSKAKTICLEKEIRNKETKWVKG